MNTRHMTLNDMNKTLRSAEKVGNMSLIEMIQEEIDKIKNHRGYGTQRGGKREYAED